MIDVNGHQFEELTDPIFVNGQRVFKVFANGKQVYPLANRVVATDIKFIIKLENGYTHTGTDGIPREVNEYVFYLLYDPDSTATPVPIHRAAFSLQPRNDGQLVYRIMFSMPGYVENRGPIVYASTYLAKDGVIVADKHNSYVVGGLGQINGYQEPEIWGGRYWYETYNLELSLKLGGRYVYEGVIGVTAENGRAFYPDATGMKDYVLS